MNKCLLLTENNQEIIPEIAEIPMNNLGIEDTLVQIHYSSLNYKDMLAFNKNSRVIPKYPIIPGIDLCGTVVESTNPQFKPGTCVFATGYDIGISHNGGLSKYAKIHSEWLFTVDSSQMLSTMKLGTAGISIYQLLQNGLNLDNQPTILVTGATGGVGSIVMNILNKLGYQNIVAMINKENKIDIAKKLGVKEIISSKDLNNKPLQKQRFDFIFDTVGGNVLAMLLPQVKYNGTVVTCDNSSDNNVETSIFPFILIGIKLIGIDSVYIDHSTRQKVWNLLLNE